VNSIASNAYTYRLSGCSCFVALGALRADLEETRPR
jgi:hypothetical protein